MQRQGVLLSGAMTGTALPSERTFGQLAGKVAPRTEQRPRHHLSAARQILGCTDAGERLASDGDRSGRDRARWFLASPAMRADRI